MNEPVAFLKAVVRHWVSLVTGGIVIALLWLWQGFGHIIPRLVYGVVAVGAVLVASYRAWRDQYRAPKEKASADKHLPIEPPHADLQRPPQPTPNPRPLGIRGTSVDTSFQGWDEVEGGLTAIKAGFFNDILPGHPVGTVHLARPFVIFRGAEGAQLGDVARCAWLDSNAPEIELEVGHSHWFCLLVFFENRWCVPLMREVANWDNDGTSFQTDTRVLPTFGIVAVEISLIGHNGMSFARHTAQLLLSNDGRWEQQSALA